MGKYYFDVLQKFIYFSLKYLCLILLLFVLFKWAITQEKPCGKRVILI